MNISINKNYTTQEKSDILDLIFFLKKMPNVQVDFHGNDEFIIYYDDMHYHISFWMNHGKDIVTELKEHIIAVHELNKDKVLVITHEELKQMNKSSADFLMEPSSFTCKTITSKEKIDSYNQSIEEIKKSLLEK